MILVIEICVYGWAVGKRKEILPKEKKAKKATFSVVLDQIQEVSFNPKSVRDLRVISFCITESHFLRHNI